MADGGSEVAGEGFWLRSYQNEMVDESLHRNVIVAMETGSGKTHIAVARAAAALKYCEPEKLVWFLVPTVTLCFQQHDVFRTSLPAYRARTISGKDEVQLWTDQRIWNAALENVRIVISTYAVLYDALSHGFMKMSRLALLVFDEAHHCVLNAPANLIMKNFYHPVIQNPNGQGNLPRILGLSASPVMRARSQAELHDLETNLDARIITPKIHRDELLNYVHSPELTKVVFSPSPDDVVHLTPIRKALNGTFTEYDLSKDPYVISLVIKVKRDADEEARDTLYKVYRNWKTYCTGQLQTLIRKTDQIAIELGSLAAERFIWNSVSDYIRSIDASPNQLNGNTREERLFLAELLRPLLDIEPGQGCTSSMELSMFSFPMVTEKVTTLFDILEQEKTSDFRGIVFADQRATVVALHELILLHPVLKVKYNVGISLGLSDSSQRKNNINGLLEFGDWDKSLQEFRSGTKNLLLATSVLEEGVDIPECHVIFCFDMPQNLVSFVQRRGRARQNKSKYFILIPDNNPAADPQRWLELEETMIAAYLDEKPKTPVGPPQACYGAQNERQFRVPSTGALLTSANAMSHLNHFCGKLKSGSFIDLRPHFSYEDVDGGIIGRVTLPTTIPPDVRISKGIIPMNTEGKARKEAAFEAILALHKKGLINDNLLPIITGPDFEILEGVNTSMTQISPLFDAWEYAMKTSHTKNTHYYRYLMTVANEDGHKRSLTMISKFPWPSISSFPLQWNQNTTYLLSVEFLYECKLTEVQVSNLDMMSKMIMDSAHPGKWSLASAVLPYMTPSVPVNDIGQMLDVFLGSDAASDILNQTTVETAPFSGGLIMHLKKVGNGRSRHIFSRFADKSDQMASADQTVDYCRQIFVTSFPKRKDFHVFRKFADHDRLDYTKEVILPVEECVVTRLPAEYSLCALFIPSLLRRLELAMVVEELNRTILRSLEIQSLSLLQVAITSRSAGEQENYQRLEFFGDCVLKLIITVQLMHEYKDWPEDFLTIAKSHKVSNATLAKACLDTGLHGFIIEKAYKSKGWFPIYTEGRSPLPKRVVSTKLLADVVEAIIGASYMDGGLQRAHKCIQIFLPSKKWVSFEDAIESLFSESTSAPVHLDDLEALVGYKFVKPSVLLEATTHPSFHSYTEDRLKSYQRLEFLGDSLLDYLLVQRVFSHEVELGDGTMTVIRASLANSWLLGFLCLEATMPKEIFDIRRGSSGASVPQGKQTETALWQFMRQGISEIAVTQGATADLHQKLRSQINTALAESATFPWDLLAQLNPGKFYSDLIESVLGAIFVDSQGDMTHCSAFLDRLGLWVLLDRILDEKVNCQHPKHRLGIAVGNKSVKYNYDEWNKDKTLPMEIFIGERRVGESGVKVTGNTKSVMETLAASQALAILQLPSKVPAAPEEFRDASMDDAVVGEAIAFDEEGDVSMDDDN